MPFGENYSKPVANLYQQWVSHNLTAVVLQAYGIAIVANFIVIIFDFFFFGSHWISYLPFRLVTISIFAFLSFVIKKWNPIIDSSSKRTAVFLIAFYGLAHFNLQYIYFFQESGGQKSLIILTAMVMNIFASQLLVHRIWIEQVSLSAFLCITFLVSSIIFPENQSSYLSLLLWSFLMSVFFFTQRRLFAKGLYSRYQGMLLQYSPKIAKAYVVLGDDNSYLQEFQPSLRPCVCICVDWRSFQEFASKNSAETVAEHIRIAHEVLRQLVTENIPKETFHADWSADEFFVTIYSDTNDVDEILNSAAHLVYEIQNKFHGLVRAAGRETVPTIDIGAASGVAVIGLLGPNNMKKLTALGDTGGRAKRYETEAKTYRMEKRIASNLSIVVMDEGLFMAARKIHPDWATTVSKRCAVTKNIVNTHVFLFVRNSESQTFSEPA